MTSIKDIKNKLIDLLSVLDLSFGVFQQGSIDNRLIESSKPKSFATFFNNETYSGGFYDNRNNKTVWDFSLNIYATDPEILSDIIEKLNTIKRDDFLIDGQGYDILTDDDDYIGRGFNIQIITKEI